MLNDQRHVHRLSKLLGDVVISQGGVVPHIDPALLPTKSGYVYSLLCHNVCTDSLPCQKKGQEGWCLAGESIYYIN
jgi:hypothetical protein